MTVQSAKITWAREWHNKTKSLYLNGQWVKPSGRELIKVVNPSTEEVLYDFLPASANDVDAAVSAAKNAFLSKTWRDILRKERARLLEKVADLIDLHRAELATLESLDNGKTYRESYDDDLPEAAQIMRYYAGWTDKFYGESCPVEGPFINYTAREPLGVCALIVPWNFPLLLAAWKIAPALAMGNTVVVKPAHFTSSTLVRLFELLDAEKIFPPGVMNLVLGGGETGDLLTKHKDVAKVSFTGSTAVGRKILENSARSNLKTLTLELGGKSANIIFDDAPQIEATIDRAFNAMFSHKGEKCSEPTRLFVHENLYSSVCEKLIKLAKNYRVGDPFDEKTQQGPQCHKEHFEKVLHYIQLGKTEGANLLSGGQRGGTTGKGYFIQPTIFGDVRPEMKIFQDEIFGPVLTVSRFSSEEEVVSLANDSKYGLAAGLYTNNISRAHRVAAKLDAGMIFINHYGCYDFASPFGGFKESGWGKEMGFHGLESFTRMKSIWIKVNEA